MKKYTKEQLIKAQHKYNTKYADNPGGFEDETEELLRNKDTAISQIEYLLSLIE